MATNHLDLTIQAPLAGTMRRVAYQSQPPFTAFDSINIWSLDTKTGRLISASRPPIVPFTTPLGTQPVTLLGKVNGVAASKPLQSMVAAFDSDIYWWDGDSWVAATGAQATAVPIDRAVYGSAFLQSFYIATDTVAPIEFNYVTGAAATVVATAGTVPVDARMIAVWQGALWLAGQLATPHIIYCSRTGDARDWDDSVPISDEGGAFSFSGTNAGLLSGAVTALMPQNEDTMIVSTIEGLFALRGHPRRGGIVDHICDTTFVLGQGAWTKTANDTLYFMTPQGLMKLDPAPNSTATLISEDKIPNSMKGIAYETGDEYTFYDSPIVSVAYDSLWNGIHINVAGRFLQSWWYDLNLGGFQEMELIGSPPLVMLEFSPIITEFNSGVLYGGSGYSGLARMEAFGDETVHGSVVVGPIKLGETSLDKMRIDKIHVVFGRDTPIESEDGFLSISTGKDGQDAVNRLLLGEYQYQIDLFDLAQNNGVCFPQVSGHAAVFHFYSYRNEIAFEELSVQLSPAGRNNATRTQQIPAGGGELDLTAESIEFNGTDWLGYVQATPDAPASTLTDFTHFIDMSGFPSIWWDNVSSTGGDIRATNDSNEELPFDIIYFDKSASTGFMAVRLTQTATPETVRIWVRGPTVSGYAADATFGQYNAYDANWIAFWPSGGARNNGESDRTRNLNNLTLVNQVTSANLTTGPIGVESTDYTFVDATNNYGLATAVVPTGEPVTFVVVASDPDTTSTSALGVRTNTGASTTGLLEIITNRGVTNQSTTANCAATGGAGASTAVSGTLANSTDFRQFVAVFASDTSRSAYINGGSVGTNATSRDTGTLQELVIGKGSRSGLSSSSVSADLALAQVHNAARSGDWVAYQFAMLNQTTFWNGWSAFVTVNPDVPDPETISFDPAGACPLGPTPVTETGTWSGYASATPIAPTNSVEPGWVHYINLALMPANWWSAVSASGVDIRATDSDNIFIPFDLIEFNKAANTGFATARLAQSLVNPREIRLWVGNATAVTVPACAEYGQYAVYDSDWVAFYPQGGGDDRTQWQSNLTGGSNDPLISPPTAGDTTGPIGNTATSYEGTAQFMLGTINYPQIPFGRDTAEDRFYYTLFTGANNSRTISQTLLNPIETPISVYSTRTLSIGGILLHPYSTLNGFYIVDVLGHADYALSNVIFPYNQWRNYVGSIQTLRDRFVWVDTGDFFSATVGLSNPFLLDRVTLGQFPISTHHFQGSISLAGILARGRNEGFSDYQFAMYDQATFWQAATWTWTAESNPLTQP